MLILKYARRKGRWGNMARERVQKEHGTVEVAGHKPGAPWRVRLLTLLAVSAFIAGCASTPVDLEKLNKAIDECFNKASFVQCMKAKGYMEEE
jgi:hypothetical protein